MALADALVEAPFCRNITLSRKAKHRIFSSFCKIEFCAYVKSASLHSMKKKIRK